MRRWPIRNEVGTFCPPLPQKKMIKENNGNTHECHLDDIESLYDVCWWEAGGERTHLQMDTQVMHFEGNNELKPTRPETIDIFLRVKRSRKIFFVYPFPFHHLTLLLLGLDTVSCWLVVLFIENIHHTASICVTAAKWATKRNSFIFL